MSLDAIRREFPGLYATMSRDGGGYNYSVRFAGFRIDGWAAGSRRDAAEAIREAARDCQRRGEARALRESSRAEVARIRAASGDHYRKVGGPAVPVEVDPVGCPPFDSILALGG